MGTIAYVPKGAFQDDEGAFDEGFCLGEGVRDGEEERVREEEVSPPQVPIIDSLLGYIYEL